MYYFLLSTLLHLLDLSTVSCWHRGVPSFGGVTLKTPRTSLLYYLCVAFL